MAAVIGYVAANPGEAACVEYGRDWPGVRSQAKSLGRATADVRRPDHYFCYRSLGYRGRLPETVPMRYELPLCVAPDERGEFIHEAEVAIREAETRARAKVRAEGRTFLGAAACRRASHDTRARSWEPTGPGTGPDPILATDPAQQRLEEDALDHFHDTYREAWSRWQAGERDVVFPAGTWHLVQYHRVVCATLPPPALVWPPSHPLWHLDMPWSRSLRRTERYWCALGEDVAIYVRT